MPGIGTKYQHQHPALAGLRYFPVSRSRIDIVFYRPIASGIEVVRVLHGARDLDRILAQEFGVDTEASDDETEEEGNPI
jgi:toxin ParE1/3/4